MAETIAAISTALAPGGIGIIRISGEKSKEIANRVFKSKTPLTEMQGYTACFGHITYEDEIIDEAVALVFCEPHSYTGEDVVELSCHGGEYVLKRALRMVLASGARQAAPGEFTKRAFLNGKMSLTEAESVMEIISASSEQTLKMANAAKEGKLYKKIIKIKEKIVSAAARISAFVDFPDEGNEEIDYDQLISDLKQAINKLKEMVDNFDAGKIMREGIDTVIVGRPNVGKSTLMNLISDFDRSIVTEHAGTTRDIIEETVYLDGIPLKISDTAGIRESDNPVEQIGVDRAKDKIKTAQLVLVVIDGSGFITEEDKEILKLIKNKNTIIILNKNDLEFKTSKKELKNYGKVVEMSARQGRGFENLKKEISDIYGLGKLDVSAAVIYNERQLDCAMHAKMATEQALKEIADGQTLDAVGMILEEAISFLNELSGERAGDTVIDEVFEKFCVGK